jgi:hypothetical protein
MRTAWQRSVSYRITFACALLLILTLVFPASLSALQATPVASPVASLGPLPPAWLEFGPGGQLLARVIVAGNCPDIAFDDRVTSMRPRTSGTPAFPVITCEAVVPFGVDSAAIGDQSLPVPDAPFTRIAVIGDTGCRLNDWEKNYQSCNDPAAWPFAQVAASAAAWQPDLIIHVGDYLYRESPCPASGFDCDGSPHGDNWPTWNADFFSPASPLLGSAPWLFMRGNHEACDRNPDGWFRFLDPAPWQEACQVYTDPYVSPLNGMTIAALDSAEASDETVNTDEQESYARQFAYLGRIAPSGSWLVTHRPVWGIFAAGHGETEAENATYRAAAGSGPLDGHYALILSGHVHLAEAIAFEPGSQRPAQLISGNSGTALDEIPSATPSAAELGDPEVEEAETLSSFGYLTLEPQGEEWLATQRNAEGLPLIECHLILPEMTCAPAGS